jgi:hypothetical protein
MTYNIRRELSWLLAFIMSAGRGLGSDMLRDIDNGAWRDGPHWDRVLEIPADANQPRFDWVLDPRAFAD